MTRFELRMKRLVQAGEKYYEIIAITGPKHADLPTRYLKNAARVYLTDDGILDTPTAYLHVGAREAVAALNARLLEVEKGAGLLRDIEEQLKAENAGWSGEVVHKF